MPSLAEMFPQSVERSNYVEIAPPGSQRAAVAVQPGAQSDPEATKIVQMLQAAVTQQAAAAPRQTTVQDISKATGLPPWLLYVPIGQQMAQGILSNQQALSQMNVQTTTVQQRQQQLELERKRFDRDGFVQLSDAYVTMGKMPAKLRKFYLGKMAEQYQALGHPLDPAYIKTLQSMNEEEIAAQGAWMKEIGRLMPGIGLEAWLNASMNPEAALQGVGMVMKLREQDMKLRQQQLLQEALTSDTSLPGSGERLMPPGASSVSPSSAPAVGGSDIKTLVEAEAVKQGVSPALAMAVAHTESRFNPRAESPVGARGVMQVMPATGQELGVQPDALWDPHTNIMTGIRYLKRMLDDSGGNPYIALQKYNAGPTGWTSGAGESYARTVLSLMPQYASQPAAQGGGMRSASGLGTGPELEAAIQRNYAILQRLQHPAIAMTDEGRAQAARVQSQLQMLLTQRDKESLPPDPEFATFAMSRGYPTPQHIPLENRQEEAIRFRQWKDDAKAREERMKQRIQREETPVPQPREVGPGGVSVGTSYGEVERMKQAGIDTRQWKTVSEKEKGWFADTEGMYTRLIKIETMARDSRVQPYLGTIWGNPEGWIDREVLARTKGLPPDVVIAVASMALAAQEFRKFYAGTAQSVQETINVDPFLPKVNEPPTHAIYKLRALVGHIVDFSNSKRKANESILERAPGDYLVLPKWEGEVSGQPVQVTPPQTPRENKIRQFLQP